MAAEWSPLPAALAQSDQLDTRQGLAVLRGNTPKYLALLRQLSAQHADDGRRLRTELAAGQADAGALEAARCAGR